MLTCVISWSMLCTCKATSGFHAHFCVQECCIISMSASSGMQPEGEHRIQTVLGLFFYALQLNIYIAVLSFIFTAVVSNSSSAGRTGLSHGGGLSTGGGGSSAGSSQDMVGYGSGGRRSCSGLKIIATTSTSKRTTINWVIIVISRRTKWTTCKSSDIETFALCRQLHPFNGSGEKSFSYSFFWKKKSLKKS